MNNARPFPDAFRHPKSITYFAKEGGSQVLHPTPTRKHSLRSCLGNIGARCEQRPKCAFSVNERGNAPGSLATTVSFPKHLSL